jgi:hypothetical protein
MLRLGPNEVIAREGSRFRRVRDLCRPAVNTVSTVSREEKMSLIRRDFLVAT